MQAIGCWFTIHNVLQNTIPTLLSLITTLSRTISLHSSVLNTRFPLLSTSKPQELPLASFHAFSSFLVDAGHKKPPFHHLRTPQAPSYMYDNRSMESYPYRYCVDLMYSLSAMESFAETEQGSHSRSQPHSTSHHIAPT